MKKVLLSWLEQKKMMGRVNKNVLTVGGVKATDEQVDVLRNWSIIPVAVVPCGQADNK